MRTHRLEPQPIWRARLKSWTLSLEIRRRSFQRVCRTSSFLSTLKPARAAVQGSDSKPCLQLLAQKLSSCSTLGAAKNLGQSGRVEHVVTGSAAGPVAAYLFSHGIADPILPGACAGTFCGSPKQDPISRDRSVGCS